MSSDAVGTVEIHKQFHPVRYKLHRGTGTLVGEREVMFELVGHSGEMVKLHPDAGEPIWITLVSGKVLSHKSGGRIAFIVNPAMA